MDGIESVDFNAGCDGTSPPDEKPYHRIATSKAQKCNSQD